MCHVPEAETRRRSRAEPGEEPSDLTGEGKRKRKRREGVGGKRKQRESRRREGRARLCSPTPSFYDEKEREKRWSEEQPLHQVKPSLHAPDVTSFNPTHQLPRAFIQQQHEVIPPQSRELEQRFASSKGH
ncbi:unnamed protein product [Pleuronectes platessa]|uniref:Uncharacterized protein n=1 Tax=Pleuronectes platessa TaxID=8262 RepID=A0A9N7V884_PLEPL|nr:unnamed protein product [Pleuronectes platessa]